MNPSRCAGTNRTGLPCRASPLRGERFCVTHHPIAAAPCWGGPLDGRRLSGMGTWGLRGRPVRARLVFETGVWCTSIGGELETGESAYWPTHVDGAWRWRWREPQGHGRRRSAPDPEALP